MKPEEYREKLLGEIEARRKRTSSYKDYLDASNSPEGGLGGLESAAGPESERELAELARAAADGKGDPRLRATALHRLASEAPDRPESIDLVLKVLADATEQVPLRAAALSALKQLLFVSPKLREDRGRYLEVLRSVSDDPDEELRTAALELLSKRKDPHTQARLMESLKKGGPYLVSPEKTIQFLGSDIHTEVYPLLREILRKPPNEAAALEAVRVLSADPESAEALSEVARDKSRIESVRNASAIALQSVKPALYEAVARELATDAGESESLRVSSMMGLERFGNPALLREDAGLHSQLEQVLESAPPASLERAARQLQSKLSPK